jgi:hypothetical protein
MYNRKRCRAKDTWFFQISVWDYDALERSPDTSTGYSPLTVLYETPKISQSYPRVETPLSQEAQVYNLDIRHLYHPEQHAVTDPLKYVYRTRCRGDV